MALNILKQIQQAVAHLNPREARDAAHMPVSIGVRASSRVETRADSYDIIVTIAAPQALPAPQ